MKRLTDFFADKKLSRILDVGTGSGDFIKELKNAFPKANITGIDPDAESLQSARTRFPDVEFKKMPAETLAFESDTFNMASISMALHHLSDVRQSFKEMQRVVKSGGWIIVGELFSDNLNQAQEVHKMYHHFRSKIDRLNGISHNKSFSKNEILGMIRESGIEIQFHFELKIVQNQVENSDDLEDRVQKMEMMLETIKHLPEYDVMKPKVKEFRAKAARYGFQPATRVVAVGKNP